MIIQIGQNGFLGEISDEFESGSCRVKNYSPRHAIEPFFAVHDDSR